MPSALPPSSPEPFDLRPTGAVRGRALLLHGFSGSPYEVLPLGVALFRAGFHAVGPLLPGHGRRPLDLAHVTAGQLESHARHALHQLSTEGPVTVVGLSTGALISAILAAAHPGLVTSLVMLAPALRLSGVGQLGIALARRGLARVIPVRPKETPGGDCGDPEGRARNTGYPVVAVGGLPALGDLQVAARANLPRVRCPVLLVHGALDQTVPVDVTAEVESLLASAPLVSTHVLPGSHHLLPLDLERDAVIDLVRTFTLAQRRAAA